MDTLQCVTKRKINKIMKLQGYPKQIGISEIATTLLWVNSGKKSN